MLALFASDFSESLTVIFNNDSTQCVELRNAEVKPLARRMRSGGGNDLEYYGDR